MIKLARPRHCPKVLIERRTKRYRELDKAIKDGEKPKFMPLWCEDGVREKIWKAQKEKCCYCERIRELKRESDVDHFRPKGSVKERDGHSGYWWLAYDWANLLYACKPCNQAHKKDHFPLLDEGRRAMRPQDDVKTEQPVLVDPYNDEPSQFITYDWQASDRRLVQALGLDEEGRGVQTIRILGLNRAGLMQERAQCILTLESIVAAIKAGLHCGNQSLVDQNVRKLREELEPDRPFTGFRRVFAKASGLAEYLE